MMYNYTDIRQVHLEITSRCNAACPMCARTDPAGGVNSSLPLTELTLADARAIFPEAFVRQLRHMYMCGNYGDPMVARDTLDVFEYFRACNPGMSLQMITNGSGRTPAWWARLARLGATCQFSIDGLEDTNALYRRGTHWGKIMEAVQAFIGAGGRAQWAFVVFRHNEHQVEEALALSRRLGFAEFFVRPTNRFRGAGPHRGGGSLDVLDRDGTVLHTLKVPRNHAYRHRGLRELGRVIRTAPSYESYLNQVPICCQAVEESGVFVSAEGLVFPCCWTAHVYRPPEPLYSTEIGRLLEQLPGGKDAVNGKLHPLREIVEGPFFQKMLPESWQKPGLAEGRLQVCSAACGQYKLYSAPPLDVAEDGVPDPAVGGRVTPLPLVSPEPWAGPDRTK